MEQILNFLVGAVGVPLVQLLKARFGIEGKPAMWLTAVVSIGLAYLLLVVTEQLEMQVVSFENLAIAFSQILSSATLIYKLILKDE